MSDSAALRIVLGPDPVLSAVCNPFDFTTPPADPELLIRGMADIVLRQRALGLAAPQIGRLWRVFVMWRPDSGVVACFNPEIVRASDNMRGAEEGCLSFPGLFPRVLRPMFLLARWSDVKGNQIERMLSGVSARCFAHEFDHLNGKTIMETAAPQALALARAIAKRRSDRQHAGIA